MKLNRLLIYICLSLAAVIIFAAADFNFSKQLIIKTNFEKSQPYVDTLYPPANVNKNLVAALPVYFKVHLPNYYDRVSISISVDNPSEAQIMIGTVTGPQVSLTPLSDKEVELTVPHSTQLKYILTTKDSKLDKPIIINSMTLRFERDRHDLKSYLQLWAKGIQKLL